MKMKHRNNQPWVAYIALLAILKICFDVVLMFDLAK